MNFSILDQCVVQVRDGGGCNCKAAGWKRITKKVMIMSRNQRKFAQGWDDELLRILIRNQAIKKRWQWNSLMILIGIMSRNQRNSSKVKMTNFSIKVFKNPYKDKMTAEFFKNFDQEFQWLCHAIKENSRKVEMTNFLM